MKRRILLAVLMVAMFICLFAISVGASDLAYDRAYTVDGVEYPLWEMDSEGAYHPLMWYRDGEGLSKVYADNTDSSKPPYVSYGSVYVSSTERQLQNFNIIDENGVTFNGKSTVVIANLHNIYLKSGSDLQITYVHNTAFRGSSVLRAVYLPETMTYIGWGSNDNLVSFQGCKALEYAEFAPSSVIKAIGPNTFLDCTALKAVSLPDSIKTLDQVSFAGCTSLKAVYLPSNLETFVYNGWDKGAFYNCSNAYFVNEPFVIENIDTDIPAKPDIYYFPASLSKLGEAFRNCPNLNDTLVFGENVTVCNGTLFTGAGKGVVKTAVFTGKMTQFYIGEGIDSTWNFVFTNTTDEGVFSARTDRGYGGTTGYLCKTNRKVLFNYGVKFEDTTTHFVDARKSEVTEPTCLTNEIATTYCFCGCKIDTTEVENSALGHEFDIADGATKASIVYSNYLANGTLNVKCARCEECNGTDVNPIISSFKGISTKENGDGLTFGYVVDYEALDEYVATSGKNVELGFVVAVKAFLGENQPLTANGEKSNDKVIKAGIYNSATYTEGDVRYTGADFVLKGNWSISTEINGEVVDIKNVVFYMAGYIIDGGEMSFINSEASGNTADAFSYNQF